ncbi:MAG: O-acetyl-ADP-ribose deacetylase [Ruminococcaceae bacterium]|nr:O-acetyl-ADP-ribose deacetylase [Oscillospiraceae bacterium]
MPLYIVRQDITKMAVDAIVNAANSSLMGGGGVDGAIHRAAGPQLLQECIGLRGCDTGEAKITKGYNLPCKHVIHTVGPKWRGGDCGEEALLRSCYRQSLQLAEKHGCGTVAFPLISAGVYGYPKGEALHVAVDSIAKHLADSDMTVYLTIFDAIEPALLAGDAEGLAEYIGSFPDAAPKAAGQVIFPRKKPMISHFSGGVSRDDAEMPFEAVCAAPAQDYACAAPSIPDIDRQLEQMDESFSRMLLRLIDRSGMTDAQCYRKANIDRRLFSKIRSDENYRPSKATVLAFAVALELSLEETKAMLQSAGFALSHSSRFDIIVEYFIKKGSYNICDINEALFVYDQTLLGSL